MGEIFYEQKTCNFICSQHLTREHGSISKKHRFLSCYPVAEENILFLFERSELEITC